MSHEVANLENEFETCKISENPSTPTAVTTQQLEETTSISQYNHFNTQAYFPRPYSANWLNQLKQLTEATKFRGKKPHKGFYCTIRFHTRWHNIT